MSSVGDLDGVLRVRFCMGLRRIEGGMCLDYYCTYILQFGIVYNLDSIQIVT
jgi:hypothetical protein